MGAREIEVGEAQRLVGVVGDGIGGHLVGQLVDEVEVGLAAEHDEDGVARATAGGRDEGRHGGPGQCGLVHAEDADEVGTQVGDDDEVACGVGDGLVRVRRLLALGVGTRLGELPLVALDEGERLGVRLVRRQSGAGAGEGVSTRLESGEEKWGRPTSRRRRCPCRRHRRRRC